MTRQMVRAFALLALLLILSAATVAAPARVLHLLTALDPNEAKIYIAAFERSTGVKVEWVRMSAGECLARLRAESRNPQFSVWFGAQRRESLRVRPVFESSGPRAAISASADASWNWVGFYFGTLGFA